MQFSEINNRPILCIYSASQTYTSTVFEHIKSFGKYSYFNWWYLDNMKFEKLHLDLSTFSAIVVHYSVRLPFAEISSKNIKTFKKFSGLKVLFIQDEYDNTNLTKKIIKEIRFNLVFSVVPKKSLIKIYPPEEFPNTRFMSNFTGYAPDNFSTLVSKLIPPSKRLITIGYRGRSLPIRYGKLGQEKINIGIGVKDYCKKKKFSCDIAWQDHSRIYGSKWYRFISKTKAMLGTESGSNVFDWDGKLQSQIDSFKKNYPASSPTKIYDHIIKPREIDGLMNQISPRIFEMAACKTVMILFEGRYSDVIFPYEHFMPLKKDFSNLDQIFEFLSDANEVDAMANRAFRDLIESGAYSYKKFVSEVDDEIKNNLCYSNTNLPPIAYPIKLHQEITKIPREARPALRYDPWLNKLLLLAWSLVPTKIRPFIKRLLGRV